MGSPLFMSGSLENLIQVKLLYSSHFLFMFEKIHLIGKNLPKEFNSSITNSNSVLHISNHSQWFSPQSCQQPYPQACVAIFSCQFRQVSHFHILSTNLTLPTNEEVLSSFLLTHTHSRHIGLSVTAQMKLTHNKLSL